MNQTDLFTAAPKLIQFVPRDYQQEAHDKSFENWDGGTRGSLVRLFTGGGKTPTACLVAGTWLARGDNHRVMIISYEKQLVWQFAQEVRDFLGMEPGIEMEKERARDTDRVVVASRASLLLATDMTEEQREGLEQHGIREFGPLGKVRAKSYLRSLDEGNVSAEQIRDQIAEMERQPEAHNGNWSRLHRFDPDLNWLLIFDEAHRHVRKLRSVGYLTEWFWANPDTRQLGLTATPKRADGISIGSEMFPSISCDYPLFHATKPCAVKDGWAVPYVQKYISVEGVDFKDVGRLGDDFDPSEWERILGEEGLLASICKPLLDLSGDRRTLVFCPGIATAENVVSFINARCEAVCPSCQTQAWHPTLLIGDGAKCDCGVMIGADHVTKSGEQAKHINGGTHQADRKAVYEGHQGGEFQFLVVVGLAREGYNDPDIGCVAIFRPVSKAASSLAEQMKGRGCRPCRALIKPLCSIEAAEDRRELIATSEKPNCLIVDLVGVTGLEDCASTASIYSEGLEDGIVDRVEQILLEEEGDIEEAIERAEREDAEERARVKAEKEEAERLAREDFERRAKANADVEYSVHDVGHGANVDHSNDPRAATPKQYRFIESLGVSICGYELTKRQAGRMIDLLLSGKTASEACYETGIEDQHWDNNGPSGKQVRFAAWKNINIAWCMTPNDASLAISARLNPDEFRQKATKMLQGATTHEALDFVARKIACCGWGEDPDIASIGHACRNELEADDDF